MRPTDLGFRSPKEKTPAFYTAIVFIFNIYSLIGDYIRR
jgi:hypothetical protein